MMKRLLVVIAGLFWAFCVFLCTGYLSFPGDALADRLEYEIQANSKKQYIAELGDLSPWWFGASTSEVKLFGRKDRTGKNPLLLYATDARVAVNPLSLLMAEPSASGSVTLGDAGTLYYAVETANVDERLAPASVQIEGSQFPVSELLALVPSAEINASGVADVKIDLEAPQGLSKAHGALRLKSRGIKLVNPVIEGMGPLGRDVTITELDLDLPIKEGKAKLSRGRMKSDVANLEVKGTVTLANVLSNSQVDLNLEVEPDESVAILKTVFSQAEKNGKLVFTCRGRLGQLDRACRPGDGKVAKARPRPRPRPRAVATPRAAKPAGSSRSTMSAEERERRKEELQERLRKRREERRASQEVKDRELEEDLPDEEFEDDLPPDDEEPLDDEELPPEGEEYIEE